MKEFRVEFCRFGVHPDTGKFHEVVVFRRHDGQEILIRRYGKESLQSRGGATMAEETYGFIAASNLVRSKSKSGYQYLSNPTSPLEGKSKMTEREIRNFYKGTSQQGQICAMLNISLADNESWVPADELTASVPAAKPKPPEIVRPSSWGTW